MWIPNISGGKAKEDVYYQCPICGRVAKNTGYFMICKKNQIKYLRELAGTFIIKRCPQHDNKKKEDCHV